MTIPLTDPFTYIGIDVTQGGSVTSVGMPNRPIIFAWEGLVQETPNLNYNDFQYAWYGFVWAPNMITFASDCESGDPVPPSLNFRFSQFYGTSFCAHVGAGQSPDFSGEFDFYTSASSAMNLTLQDCQLTGGGVELGLPEADTNYCSGAVNWQNSSFDEVFTWLFPSYGETDLNTDLSLQITGSLFRGSDFDLSPIPASAGDWGLTNNLFDLVLFYQDTTEPLACEHDGYWAYLPDQVWPGFGWTTNLQAVASGDPTQEPGEVFLPAAPPYQTGPFGNYYLPTNTLLYGAASDTAANLGLFHYTTRPDQVKEGNDTPTGKPNASIGLHYIAAASGLPIDTDGDGIPDYVEDANGNGFVDSNETDWTTQFTTQGVWDPTNSVYLNVDLSGDGLVNRIKIPFGMNPFDTSNPQTLVPATTSQEPDIIGYEVAINYDTLTNIGSLHLTIDGYAAELQECDQAPDGNCLLKWNTDYEAPGQHCLQTMLSVDQNTDETVINTACGPLSSFVSANLGQFSPACAGFNSSATFYAATPTCSTPSYTIKIYDPSTVPPTLVKTFGPSSGSGGIIEENWDMMRDDTQTPFTGTQLEAQYEIAPQAADSPGQTPGPQQLGEDRHLAPRLQADSPGQTPGPQQPPGTTIQKQKLNFWPAPNGSRGEYFDMAYANNINSDYLKSGGELYLDMQQVVNELLKAGNAYQSAFNWVPDGQFNGNPGWIATPGQTAWLLSDLQLNAANFYFLGHGDPISIGDGTGNPNGAQICVDDVEGALGNIFSADGITVSHPYRFVFLDACETGANNDWKLAFGICQTPNVEPSQFQGMPQAFLGWQKEFSSLALSRYADRDPANGTVNNATIDGYMATIYMFYQNWMEQMNLNDDINYCKKPHTFTFGEQQLLSVPLATPGNNTADLEGDPSVWWRVTSPLRLWGYPGLKRTGSDPIAPGIYTY